MLTSTCQWRLDGTEHGAPLVLGRTGALVRYNASTIAVCGGCYAAYRNAVQSDWLMDQMARDPVGGSVCPDCLRDRGATLTWRELVAHCRDAHPVRETIEALAAAR